jgi:hypothetical protein
MFHEGHMRFYLMNNTGTWVSWERWLWKRLGVRLSLVWDVSRLGCIARSHRGEDVLVHNTSKRKGWDSSTRRTEDTV